MLEKQIRCSEGVSEIVPVKSASVGGPLVWKIGPAVKQLEEGRGWRGVGGEETMGEYRWDDAHLPLYPSIFAVLIWSLFLGQG